MESARLNLLIQRYISNTLSPEEWQELSSYMENNSNEAIIVEAMAEAGLSMSPTTYDIKRFDKILQTILDSDKPSQTVPVRRLLIRWSAAASIIFLLALGSYVLFNKKVTHSSVAVIQKNDIDPPSSNRANITLTDGSTLYLDSAADGQLASQGNTSLVKLNNGQIVYRQGNDPVNGKTIYNTLTNPRGSKVISMTLGDGSQVWLNAGSSITYPVAFVGTDRRVSINGEAYFEVAHDASKPFYVTKADMQVRVLGTRFNVNAYDDEKEIRVTLLEGSVKISHTGKEQLLKPGQQAIVNTDISIDNAVDVAAVMAWKNGKFTCTNMNLEAIMRQLSRWYDVEVVYKDKVNDNYTVDVPRTVPVSQLFHFIEMSGGVHFEIGNRKIIVSK